MHDIKLIRENPDDFDKGRLRRGLEPLSNELLRLDDIRKAAILELQKAQERRNAASKEIGIALKAGEGVRANELKVEVAEIKEKWESLEQAERDAVAILDDLLASLPNTPSNETPDGKDEHDNLEILKWGVIPSFDFKPKEHFEIGESLGLMDFTTAAKLSGARFVINKGALARLERALAQFMLDKHTAEHGYIEINPPLLVRDEAMFGTAQLPKFREDQFSVDNGYWLIPTAEVPLTNLIRESILEEGDLPLRFTAGTYCFRAEAGAAGRDTRGMIRQHQFYKVELVSITTPDQSLAEHERMTACAEKILQDLNLPYRKVLLCAGDMGFASKKTYDLEVWLPGQNMYREISSCSNCGDFQARRMGARFRAAGEKGTQFVHTLNGSGVAVGRCLVAVLENYQQSDGSVAIPHVLQPYMNGLERISPMA
jgi:seryl-tRNA synthetase